MSTVEPGTYKLMDHLQDPMDRWATMVEKRIADLERRIAELERPRSTEQRPREEPV